MNDGTSDIATLVSAPDSGDTDGDGILDVGETWSWTLSEVVINEATTFTATGTDLDSLDNEVAYPEYPNEQDEVTVEAEALCWGEDTVWAYGGDLANPNNEIAKSNNWGWTNGPLEEGSYEWEIYAGASQNDIDKGTPVGMLHVEYEDLCVTVTYEMDEGFFLGEAHLWVGTTPPPEVFRRKSHVPAGYTNAPGQFPFGEDFEIDKDDPNPTKRPPGHGPNVGSRVRSISPPTQWSGSRLNARRWTSSRSVRGNPSATNTRVTR